MPFDLSPQVETKPIDRLIEALRGPEPKGWDFNNRCRCAMGMAAKAGLCARPYPTTIALAFGMYINDAHEIFEPLCLINMSRDLITTVRPRHVAAALEHYRDTGIALSPFHFVQQERSNAV